MFLKCGTCLRSRSDVVAHASRVRIYRTYGHRELHSRYAIRMKSCADVRYACVQRMDCDLAVCFSHIWFLLFRLDDILSDGHVKQTVDRKEGCSREQHAVS